LVSMSGVHRRLLVGQDVIADQLVDCALKARFASSFGGGP
jgi:hypothetical protein